MAILELVHGIEAIMTQILVLITLTGALMRLTEWTKKVGISGEQCIATVAWLCCTLCRILVNGDLSMIIAMGLVLLSSSVVGVVL